MSESNPFNSGFRKVEDKGIRDYLKKNRKKIIYLSIFAVAFSYGSLDYLIDNTLRLEVRTARNNRIAKTMKWNIDPDEEIFTNYRVINKSPYGIKLIIIHIEYEGLMFETNYNNSVIEPDMDFWIWFKLINNNVKPLNCEIRMRGDKV